MGQFLKFFVQVIKYIHVHKSGEKMGPIFSLILTLIKVFGWGNCLSLVTLNEWQLAGLQPVHVLLSVTKLHSLDRGACECTTLQTVVLNPKHRGWVRDTIGKPPMPMTVSQHSSQWYIGRQVTAMNEGRVKWSELSQIELTEWISKLKWMLSWAPHHRIQLHS